MDTDITDNATRKGWIFFDATCALCVRGRWCVGRLFEARGFVWTPLQTPGAAARLGLSEAALHEEMQLQLADGRVLAGVDAWAWLLRTVWWLWPVGALLAAPGFRGLSRTFYRWIARNRYCFAGRCRGKACSTARHRHSAFFEMP